MDAYLPRFQDMVKELQQQSLLQLLHFSHYPGLSLSEIEALEQRYLEHPLPPAARRFYQETNGLQLQWILEKNTDFDPEKHRYRQLPLDWDYACAQHHPEDGMIMIWPLERLLQQDWKGELYLESMRQRHCSFAGELHNAYDFARQLKPFDLFSADFNMAFWTGTADYPVLLGHRPQSTHLNSHRTSFASYLEFLLATYGYCLWRQHVYSLHAAQKQPLLETPAAYWQATSRGPQLAQLALSARFPLADQPGASMNKIDRQAMRRAARQSKVLEAEELQQSLAQHEAFLHGGGAGGQWQTVLLRGQVRGLYIGVKSKKGKQVNWEQRQLAPDVDLVGIRLPYANLCSLYAPKQDFSEADLSHALLTDAFLEEGIFAEANLEGADLSRSYLRGASFMNANLRGVDFENADLRGVDFRGALLNGARFPGGQLKGIRY